MHQFGPMMSTNRKTIIWIRNDLRFQDNPALAIAAEAGDILPVFIWDIESHGAWAPGAASRVWLHHGLNTFRKALAKSNVPFVIREGDSVQELRKLVVATGADQVVWNRRYEPALRATDERVKQVLADDGVEVQDYPGNLLFEPWTVETKAGDPYKVFTPFWRTCLDGKEPLPPFAVPEKMRAFENVPASLSVDDLDLLPHGEGEWARSLIRHWEVGERAAWDRFQEFLNDAVAEYDEDRDLPGIDGTSLMSPYLQFGEISVRRMWTAVRALSPKSDYHQKSIDRYLAELGWREFAHHLLYHFPDTTDQPLRKEFEEFPWSNDLVELEHWQQGKTGYPIVDAGMRQLWREGWMHNRVRMIVASFLTKDLLIPWQIGARWFWDTLVDANLANNTLGWQWTAGCGADAAPYFRIFNPVTQGQRYDPDGSYVREYVPELKELEGVEVHEPWLRTAPALFVNGDGQYPDPMVEHSLARNRALMAYDRIKK